MKQAKNVSGKPDPAEVADLRRAGLSYGQLAAEMGCTVRQVRYALELAEDAPNSADVAAARRQPTHAQLQARAEARRRQRARVRASCTCPRSLWIARGVLGQAPILCMACGQPFKIKKRGG